MTKATGGNGFPLPGTGRATVAAPAPGPGEGRWVGAPSAVLEDDVAAVLADREGMEADVADAASGESEDGPDGSVPHED